VHGIVSRKRGEAVELVDIVVPDPGPSSGPGEVIVDVTACGYAIPI
jgi:S-(hydroxymethyl)mycothiol dehydrogenase